MTRRVDPSRLLRALEVEGVGPDTYRITSGGGICPHRAYAPRGRSSGDEVDSLSKFWSVEDENDATQVTAELERLLDLARQTGVGIIVIHHLRKSGGIDKRADRRAAVLWYAVAVRFGPLEGLETPRFSWTFGGLGT